MKNSRRHQSCDPAILFTPPTYHNPNKLMPHAIHPTTIPQLTRAAIQALLLALALLALTPNSQAQQNNNSPNANLGPSNLGSVDVGPVSLDPVAILEEMDAELATKIVAAAAKIQQWKLRIQRAQNNAQRIDDAKGDPQELAKVVLEIAPELKTLAASHPKLNAIIRYQQRVETILREADQTWKNAKYEAEKYKNLDEKQFREKMKQEALAIASQKLRTYFDSEVFNVIDAYKDPAEYAQNFVEGEFRQWVSQPMKVDDAGELQLRVLPPPPGTSIFSPKAKLGVEIVYLPGQLTVKATGFYFQYRPGQSPKPMTDQMKVEVDVTKTVLNNVKALGEELLADTIGSPIKITLKNQPDFSSAQSVRGGIRFDVEFKMFETVTVKGSDLVLYPGNKIDWKDGKLDIKTILESPVPIPPAPAFAFWEVGGGYGPKTGEVSFETKISTTATPPKVVALALKCSTKFPVKYIQVDGKLLIANIGIAETQGKIDFSKGTLDASFKTASDIQGLIPGFSLGEGKLHLQREHLIVDSRMEIFGMNVSEMHGEFNFNNGSGILTSREAFNLFGVDFSHQLQAELGERFSFVTLRSVANVEVSGIKPYGSLSCTVLVEADSRKGTDPVKITVKTFRKELDITLTVPNLNACTLALLRDELNKKAVEAYHQLLKELANGDKEARKIAAQWDAKSKDWVNKHFGGAWETGVPELDNLGSKLADEWKKAGGSASDEAKRLGGNISNASKDLQKQLSRVDPGRAIGRIKVKRPW